MKKLFILTFWLGLILSLVACNSNKTASVSIKIADGWEKLDNNYYAKDNGYTTIKAEFLISSNLKEPDQYVEEIINASKDFKPDVEFSEISHTKAGKEDAIEYTFVSDGQKYRDIYIFKDTKVCSIICIAYEADYEAAAIDFQTMIDSFTLK